MLGRKLAERSTALLSLLLFLVAVPPRLAAIGRYVTPDELNWVYRAIGLRHALLAGEWAQTIQSGHPGVITTWIGAVTIQLQQWLQPGARLSLAWLQRLYWLSTDNAEAYRHLYLFLSGARLAVAMLTAAGVVCVFLVARDLLGRRTAFLGALLLATDPFFSGLSGLLHVDALLATFVLLALLLALKVNSTSRHNHAHNYAALAGVTTALAILTKIPGLILVGFVPLLLIWPSAYRMLVANRRRTAPSVAFIHSGSTLRERLRGAWKSWQQPVTSLLIWALALVLGLVFLLPAIWAEPAHVLETITGLTGRLVEDAVRPTFFLGRMALDHGPLFYPVAVLFRLSPAATIGLLASLPVFGRQLWQRKTTPVAQHILWLLLFSLIFLVFVSLVAKKFDRYALPALVALSIAGGWGIDQLAAWLQKRLRLRGTRSAVIAGFLVLQASYLLIALPFPLTAYNWLAGGRKVAAGVLPAGWGEDAGVAARWLTEQLADPENHTLFTNAVTGTAPFFPGRIVRLQPGHLPLLTPDDYILIDAGEGQAWDVTEMPGEQAPWETFLERVPPVKQLSFDGVSDARLFSHLAAADFGLPALSLQREGYRFGEGLQLVSSGGVSVPWPEKTLIVLGWQTIPGVVVAGVFRLQLQLLNKEGAVRATWEWPLLNGADHVPAFWQPGEPELVSYTPTLPADLPPGDYHLIARVFDEEGALLGVFDAGGDFAGTTAPTATIAVAPPSFQPELDIPHRQTAPGVERGGLVGFGAVPSKVSTGERLTLDLWWQRPQANPLTFDVQLGRATLTTTVETDEWKPDQIYHIQPSWRVPLDLAAGTYRPMVVWFAARGERQSALLGEIEIVKSEREFTLPAGLTPFQVQLGAVAYLQDVKVEVAGENLIVHVIWQAREPDRRYTTFVHLWQTPGVNISQEDRAPDPPPDTWVSHQVIVDEYVLPRPAPGLYTIAIGLYDPDTGLRLPVYLSDGTRLEDDQYLVEVEVP